jgi:hypothetical protein
MALSGAAVSRRPRSLLTMDPASAERLARAVLASLDSWIEQLEEIEANANPGNKSRSLHLLRSMGQAKVTLTHMMDDPES